MLSLNRKHGESIIIDGNIEVKVYFDANRRNQVKLCVSAPKNITVHRKEIQDLINSEKLLGEKNEISG